MNKLVVRLLLVTIASTYCLASDNTASNEQFFNNEIPNETECGFDPLGDKIYDGTMADIGEFPWLVLLEYIKPTGKGSHCGGVLISSRYVLTAAHCIRSVPRNWKLRSVRLGEWNTKTDPDCDPDGSCAPSVVISPVESVVVHPKYDNENQQNDIALLRLLRNVEYTDFIKPICLPNINSEVRRMSLSGTELIVAGWGKTEDNATSDILLKLGVPGVPFNDCKSKYASQNITLGSLQFCAGGNKGQDACRGDSGGPLMLHHIENKKVNWYVMGVVSFGPSPCGLAGWPGVYTRVGSYSKWISENILP